MKQRSIRQDGAAVVESGHGWTGRRREEAKCLERSAGYDPSPRIEMTWA